MVGCLRRGSDGLSGREEGACAATSGSTAIEQRGVVRGLERCCGVCLRTGLDAGCKAAEVEIEEKQQTGWPQDRDRLHRRRCLRWPVHKCWTVWVCIAAAHTYPRTPHPRRRPRTCRDGGHGPHGARLGHSDCRAGALFAGAHGGDRMPCYQQEGAVL